MPTTTTINTADYAPSMAPITTDYSRVRDIAVKSWTMISNEHQPLVTVTVTRFRLNRNKKWTSVDREYTATPASIARAARLITTGKATPDLDATTIMHRLRQLDKARLYLCSTPITDYGAHSLAISYLNQDIDTLEAEYRARTGERIDIVDYRDC